MIEKASQVPNGAEIRVDVCIVGAGPAGLAVASVCAAAGRSVCLLESGDWEPDAATQSLACGEIAGLPYYPLDANRQRCIGGTLRLWAGWCRPLDPLDLAARDWVPDSGWPLGERDLAPYWLRAHDLLKLDPPLYDPAHWERTYRAPLLTLPQDELMSRVYRLAETGVLLQYARARLIPAPNVRLLTRATALELRTDPAGGRVTGIEAGGLDGRRFRVLAGQTVLAAGAIENARLLLLSRRARPEGLGNAHDRVGRYFMEHIHFPCGGLRLADPAAFPGRLYFRSSLRDTIARIFPTPGAMRREGMLNGCTMLEPIFPGWAFRALHRLEQTLLAADRWTLRSRLATHLVRRYAGPAAAAAFRQGNPLISARAPESVLFAHTLEQAPNPESRVTLGAGLDAFGQPRARLDWRTTDLDRHTARRLRELVTEGMVRAGLGSPLPASWDPDAVWPPEPLQGSRGHHMGTTRMHPDPKRGVVDPDSRVHGVDNLYVAGSSVFPTSGAGTPTLTLLALALRLGDRLARATA
jgi:choline dehydrogenase-like flavoprotein